MANIAVTKTTNTIAVDFGDYSSALNIHEGTWKIDKVVSIKLNTTRVEVNLVGEVVWYLSFDGSAQTFQVDTVSAVAPTSNSDLYSKLIALIT